MSKNNGEHLKKFKTGRQAIINQFKPGCSNDILHWNQSAKAHGLWGSIEKLQSRSSEMEWLILFLSIIELFCLVINPSEIFICSEICCVLCKLLLIARQIIYMFYNPQSTEISSTKMRESIWESQRANFKIFRPKFSREISQGPHHCWNSEGPKAGFPFSGKCRAIDFLHAIAFFWNVCSQAHSFRLNVCISKESAIPKSRSRDIFSWMEIRLNWRQTEPETYSANSSLNLQLK